MGLNFKENDIVGKKEDKLEEVLFEKNPQNAEVLKINKYIDDKDRLMLHTIMSTLFKLRSKKLYMIGKIPDKVEEDEETIWEIEIIIRNLYKALKNNRYDKIKDFLNETKKNDFLTFLMEEKNENRKVLSNLLYDYYYDKNTNYIGEKFYLENITKQKSAREILSLNPYMISQLLDYQQKPLTKEELIIQEIMDYLKYAEWNYYESDKIIKCVINLFEQNNQKIGIMERKILFIVSNVFQESKERNDNYYGKMMYLLESTKYDPEIIINCISRDKKTLIEIIKKFIEYNRQIEEGRLEELEQKPSSKYAKKIYRKNP
jgi:hypothetical protein